MLKLEIENLAEVSAEHGLTMEEITNENSKIEAFLEKIAARKQGFLEILDDTATVQKVLDFAASAKGKYENIVILGIGGSALGPICLAQTLGHLYANELTGPKLYVIDNIDPTLIKEVEEVIKLEKTLFLIITKSGTTPETLAQYNHFRNRCESQNLDIKNHFVFITDPAKGHLREIANQENIPTFEIPENVGGRFSVLTPVGLLPAALLGFSLPDLLAGAHQMRELFLSSDPTKNLPFLLANISFLLSKKGKTINVMMPYAQKLIRIADWYRQLLAESIGKRLDNAGQEVFTGITPVNALGVTDQHSQTQLYNEGPNDKLFTFIEAENLGPEITIPAYTDHPGLTFNRLIATEKKGTELAFTKNNRPNITIKVDSINENTLGQLFLLFEGQIAFLGEFFNINAFDQPGVELSKILTHELLNQQ